MNLWTKMFAKDQPPPPPEHAVIVRLSLSDDGMGTEEERDSIHEMTDRLDAAIIDAGAGEYDGDEFGEGTCTLYMYGPDADALYAAIESRLVASPFSAGAHVTKRYGDASDPDAREERFEL